ncbi:CreA family protein [Roseibium polysiphoniae]|uniref:CreA family protein n=1 Tax=Roseibium polysiphoniae TaxID=2571221 RepID=A0ABR9C6R4_9HYPH|nr:CreA family protein [Roseibium polysiphoniae]MBD8875209.1 CreA family protein [Roseibium polysiphoniae]
MRITSLALSLCLSALALSPIVASAADEPDLIFKKSTVWKFLTPDHKLATYAIDDPIVSGVACHFTVPEKGGISGWVGVAEEVSDVSLACRQVGPIEITEKFEQGEEMFRQRRSFVFKKMRIVRGCDVKRNVLVYLVYSDKLIEGSPKNSTSTVPLMPWGDQTPPRCGDYLDD